MTISEALKEAKETLSQSSTTPALDAEILLCAVLQNSRSQLISDSERSLTRSEEKTFKELIQQRAQGLPIAYVKEEKEFYGRKFVVTPAVLIPRPETELLIEKALQMLEKKPEIKQVLDIGTGSGVIAITVKKERPQCAVIASDISNEALVVARQNAAKMKCPDIEFVESDLLEKLPDNNKETLLLANLPYIKDGESIHEETLEYEPHGALFSGPLGLDHYERLLQQVSSKKNIRILLLEIGFDQAQDILLRVHQYLPGAECQILKDLAHIDRICMITR